MSPKLMQCGKAWDQLSNKEKAAAKSAMASMDKMQKRASSMISSILKLGSALAVSAIGLGFSEALGLEKYRMQLETATKDTARAAEVMQYAVNLANTTPFEGGDMVAASAALEMASLATETYLTTLGDTAAGVNRSISDVQTQFIKAFSTGQTGEFFDSINVSRKSFEDFAKANKLSITSIEGTQIALKKFLDEKFGGGMANLAKTTAGAWSTITGVTKSALAQMVGMGTDGTVRVGSALDKLREKAQYFSEKLVEWQENGQIDRCAREIGNALSAVWDIGEKVFATLWKYRDLVAGLAAAGAAIWAMQKAMAAYKVVTEVARVATMLLNGTLSVSPLGVVALALGLAVSAGLSWISTATAASEASDKLAQSNRGLEESINGVAVAQKNSVSSGEKGTGGGILKGIGLKIVEDVKNAYIAVDSFARDFIGDVDRGVGTLFTNPTKLFRTRFPTAHANGTQYHTGGLALVGERGPELVRLPAGSRVTTAEKTRKLGGGTIVNNYITVSGANRSDEEIADMVARRIVEVAENTW